MGYPPPSLPPSPPEVNWLQKIAGAALFIWAARTAVMRLEKLFYYHQVVAWPPRAPQPKPPPRLPPLRPPSAPPPPARCFSQCEDSSCQSMSPIYTCSEL